jgi:hypothetical protein
VLPLDCHLAEQPGPTARERVAVPGREAGERRVEERCGRRALEGALLGERAVGRLHELGDDAIAIEDANAQLLPLLVVPVLGALRPAGGDRRSSAGWKLDHGVDDGPGGDRRKGPADERSRAGQAVVLREPRRHHGEGDGDCGGAHRRHGDAPAEPPAARRCWLLGEERPRQPRVEGIGGRRARIRQIGDRNRVRALEEPIRVVDRTGVAVVIHHLTSTSSCPARRPSFTSSSRSRLRARCSRSAAAFSLQSREAASSR